MGETLHLQHRDRLCIDMQTESRLRMYALCMILVEAAADLGGKGGKRGANAPLLAASNEYLDE